MEEKKEVERTCSMPYGFSDGQILPGQLPSDLTWSLVCGCKCFSGRSQGLGHPSSGYAGSLPCGEAGEKMLSSGPRQGGSRCQHRSCFRVAWDAIGRVIKEKGCEW